MNFSTGVNRSHIKKLIVFILASVFKIKQNNILKFI